MVLEMKFMESRMMSGAVKMVLRAGIMESKATEMMLKAAIMMSEEKKM